MIEFQNGGSLLISLCLGEYEDVCGNRTAFVALCMASLTVSNKLEYLSSAVAVHEGNERVHVVARRHLLVGRRGLFLSAMFASSATLTAQAEDSKTALLQKYLKKSEENRAKNEKQRLDDFYRRNYKDYFEFIQGGLEGKKEEQLTESEKGILEWLKTHK